MRRFKILCAVAGVLGLMGCRAHGQVRPKKKAASSVPSSAPKASAEREPYAILDTTLGTIEARLFPDVAPRSVENFIGLALGTKAWTDPATGRPTRRPLYAGTTFFRSIPGYMIQGGSPLNGPYGGPGYALTDEFSSAHVFNKPGLLAMANSGPNTNGSQFFITLVPAPWLDGRYTIFGEVTKGLAVVEAISVVPRDDSSAPLTPIVLKSVRVEYR